MAANFKETAMNTVIIERKRLQATLSANLEIHKKEFEEAIAGFREKRMELYRELRDVTDASIEGTSSASRKKVSDAFYTLNQLERPVNNSNSYEQAIVVMEWETRDEIELSIHEFEAYVRDNWNWTASFKNAHANYSSPVR